MSDTPEKIYVLDGGSVEGADGVWFDDIDGLPEAVEYIRKDLTTMSKAGYVSAGQVVNKPERRCLMTDTSKEYIQKVCNAAPFADNDAGISEMVSLIKALADELDELKAVIDSTEIEYGLTSNGNLWRFWSNKARAASVRNLKLLNERDARLAATEDKLAVAVDALVKLDNGYSVHYADAYPYKTATEALSEIGGGVS